jgi:hypothetical protein
MKKLLITLGIIAAVAVPAAAFAQPGLSIGVNLGGPVYSAPPPVVYEQPAPVYTPPAVVYGQPGYVYGPTAVYPGYYGYHGYYGPHYYHHYGYRW